MRDIMSKIAILTDSSCDISEIGDGGRELKTF